VKNVTTTWSLYGKFRPGAATKLQLSLCVAQNADIHSENTHKENIFSKKFILLFDFFWCFFESVKSFILQDKYRRTIMPKKEKPLTKKERDEKRKAKKTKQSKTQTS
jgi:hypothetical protein